MIRRPEFSRSYGYAKERAEQELSDFTDSMKLVKLPREWPTTENVG